MSSVISGSDSFDASFQIPSDGDGPPKAADVNVPFEALANRTTFLAGLVQHYAWSYLNEGAPVIGTDIWMFSGATYAVNLLDSTAFSVSITDVKVGDIFLASFHGAVAASGGAGGDYGLLALHATDNVGTGTETRIDSAVARLNITAPPDMVAIVGGKWVAAAAGTTRIRLLGRVVAAPGVAEIGIYSQANLSVVRIRHT